MEPPNAAHRGGSTFEWKKKALERSYNAGQRHSKHLRKRNKFVPRPKTRGDVTKPNDAEANKNLAYEENVRLNSLISNLTERSEFGITMEEDDDISNGLMPDGLTETMPEDNVSELALLGLPRDVATTSPEVVGCVTIDGFAFRTFPSEGSEETSLPWVKSEPDQDVKPCVEELNRIRCPTKTTDITKIKGWRNKVFAGNDAFTVKQESEENWDANNSLVDESKSLNFTQSEGKTKNDMEDPTLLNCALTLPYGKKRPAVPIENNSPKKQARLSNRSANKKPKTTKYIPCTATAHIQPISMPSAIQPPVAQPITVNPARKPKTKAEYRRMLEEAARSCEASDVDDVPVVPPVVPHQKPGRLKYFSDEEAPCELIDRSKRELLPKHFRDTGRVDKRLKAYRDGKAEEVKVTGKLHLDSRYMYALVEGRPIKIGGSELAKKMADTKIVDAAKPAKISPPRMVDARYTSLLAKSETPKPPAPIVKHRNRGRPLSKKLEAKEKRLQEFCLRVHPAVGFPLTESALEQISLLRDDRMEINEDWINFATTVVNSKKKAHYHRKGFVDNIIPTADVFLPVRVTRSGNRYEMGNMENFNSINVSTVEAPTNESETYLKCEQNLEEVDAVTSDIGLLLRSMIDSVVKQEAVEDLHLLAEPEQEPRQSKESLSEPLDFLNPTRAAAHPRKRRSALNSELRRLNVLVIEERDADVEEAPEAPAKPADAPACQQEHCKFGCLCHSLKRSGTEASHCGRPDCMFECACGGPPGTEERIALPKSVVSKINESTKYLARTEKEFQRAVVCNKNEMLVVDGCAAPTTGRRKREVKLPLRFRESGIDDKLLFGGNANLEVMEARKNERKVEDPQSESTNIKTELSTDPNEDPTFGLGGRPFFVPNHVRHAEFFRRRAENRTFEQGHTQQYQLKSSKVVIYRAKLDNVQPYCILHNLYACPCMKYISSLPGEASHNNTCNFPQTSPTRSPGRKQNALPFQGSVGKRRNFAVKRTAPRFLPTSVYPNRCSRTEAVNGSYVIRNRKPTYKASLKGQQEAFRARLYGAGKSVSIPGSQILRSVKSRSDDFDDRVLRELSDEDADGGGSSSDASPQPVRKENIKSASKTLPNRTQIIGKLTDMVPVVKGSTEVQIPPNSEAKMMRWSMLQDGFLNNSLQMWLSSPEIGSPRLYVSSSVKAPDVKCRNLRNWTGKTESGYPPLVSELMEQIPNESAADVVRFGVMLKRKDYWEVIGIRRLTRRSPPGLANGSKVIKFLKDNAIMSVPLPTNKFACRWHVIFINCHFDRIVFQGCVIVEKNIIQLCESSQTTNSVYSILFKENFPLQYKSLNLLPEFGLYALPKISECVFLGPFRLDGSKGDVVTMFKDVTAKGKDSTTGRIFVEVVQSKSRASWLYTEGLLEGKAENISNLPLNTHAKSPAVKKAVAPYCVPKVNAKESLVRKKLAAAVEHSYKSPMKIASSLKKKMMYSGLQRSKIGSIAAKKVAASKVLARRSFPANNPVDSAKPSTSTIPRSPIKKTSPLSLLKVALSVSKDCEYPLPVDGVVEEIATSYAEDIIGLTPIMHEETIKMSPVKLNVRILSPPPAESQIKLTPYTVEVMDSLPPIEKNISEDVSNAVARFRFPVDRNNPPPLSLLRSRSSAGTVHSRPPSVNHVSPGSLASEANSCTSVLGDSVPEVTITAPLANRPGLTITGRCSVVKAAAVGCKNVLASNGQVAKEFNSDSDVEILDASGPAIDKSDCDIMVVPRTWQPGTLPPVLSAEYEPAEINTMQLGEMSVMAIEGSKRVKYVPSIPSLGYVEACRLPNSRLRIRFLNKTFVEATVSSNAILQYLDKSIRNNPLLRVEPPDLPLTWKLAEDMSSFPEVPAFNYTETFDGNHMLCEKGLLRIKMTPKVTEPGQKVRDEDIIALERLKSIIKAPDIRGVSLEETLSQAAAEILQCKRLEQDLQYKRDWWLRRHKKMRKRYMRTILTLPNKEDQQPWLENMEAILKRASATSDDSSLEIVDLVDEAKDNANDPWRDQDVVDISEPNFSLSGITPRRLEAILFPADASQAGAPVFPTRPTLKYYAEKQAFLGSLTIQPTRSSVSLLRKTVHQPTSSGQTVIPLMDLTDDSAQPTVVLQKQPELPVINLDDEDDDEEWQPTKQPALSVEVDKPNPDRIVYSYGVNNLGHFFRCAIIGNRIVNKVRITKVPDNVECLKMVEQTNAATITKKVDCITSGAIAKVVKGTQQMGIRVANAIPQGNQAANNKVFVIGTTGAFQNLGHKAGAVPIGKRLANTKVPMSKMVSILNPVNSSVLKSSVAPVAAGNARMQKSNQILRKEIFVIDQTSPPTVPTTVRLACARVQSSKAGSEEATSASSSVSNSLESEGQTMAGTALNSGLAITVPNNSIQLVGAEDKSIEREHFRAVVDQLISTGKLTENTRQIMIKGPIFTNTPNILKRVTTKLAASEIKDVHIQVNAVKTGPPSQPGVAVLTDKQLVKISSGELQRLNSLANKVHPGKPITLKIKTAPTQRNTNCKTHEKSRGSQSGLTDVITVQVGKKPSVLAGALTSLPGAVADEDNVEKLVIDEDAHEEVLVSNNGLLLDTGVDLEHSELVVSPTEVNPEKDVADIEETMDLGDQVDDEEDAKLVDDLFDDKLKSDLDNSQSNAEIVANDVKSQGSTSTVAFHCESQADMEICEPIVEQTTT